MNPHTKKKSISRYNDIPTKEDAKIGTTSLTRKYLTSREFRPDYHVDHFSKRK
jgi:hypothetical protein